MLLQRNNLTPDQKTHDRILESAMHLFAAQGYERTTTKQLAEASHVAEGTLFRHFENKKSILAAVISEGWDTLLNDLLTALCESDYRDMVALLQYRIHDFHQHSDLVKVCLTQTPFYPDLCEPLQQERLRQMQEVLEAFIQTGIDRGFYRPLDPQGVAQVMLVLFLGTSWIDSTLLSPQSFSGVQIANTLADILMHGLLKRPD